MQLPLRESATIVLSTHAVSDDCRNAWLCRPVTVVRPHAPLVWRNNNDGRVVTCPFSIMCGRGSFKGPIAIGRRKSPYIPCPPTHSTGRGERSTSGPKSGSKTEVHRSSTALSSCHFMSLPKVTEVSPNAGELADGQEIAGDDPNESPLRHHLLTDPRLQRVYLICPSPRPIRSDVGETHPLTGDCRAICVSSAGRLAALESARGYSQETAPSNAEASCRSRQGS
jgi:hypothetical protein